MIHIIIFNILLIATSGYAIIRGGAPEKIAGWPLIAAAALTVVTGWHPAMFSHVETSLFLVDFVLLATLLVIALKADRFWPLVLAAIQLNSTAVHILKLFDADLIRVTYAVMVAMWSYPMQILLVIATMRHQRRLALFGEDRAWKVTRPR